VAAVHCRGLRKSFGDKVVLETRLWDERAGRTVPMRGKEEAHDYRYFPEPDLGALRVDDAWIAEAASALPELPRVRRARFVEAYGIAPADAETLTSAKELADYFEAVSRLAPPRLAANWVTGEVLRWMKERKWSPEDAMGFSVSPERLASLLRLLESGDVSAASAKDSKDRRTTTSPCAAASSCRPNRFATSHASSITGGW